MPRPLPHLPKGQKQAARPLACPPGHQGPSAQSPARGVPKPRVLPPCPMPMADQAGSRELCFLAALVPTPVGRGWNLLCSFFRVGAPSPKVWPAAGFESLQHSSKTDVTGRGKRCTARDGGLDCVLSRRPGPMQPSVREKPSQTVIRRFSS